MDNAILGSDDDFSICDPTRLIARDARDDDFSICDPTRLMIKFLFDGDYLLSSQHDARDDGFSIRW